MQFEKLLDGLGAVEAPRVDEHGNFYCSDMVYGGLYKRTPDGALHHLLRERNHIGGLLFNQDGRLLCSGAGGLVLFDETTNRVTPLLTQIEGRTLEVVNDIKSDDEGGLYGGAIDYSALAAGRPPAYGLLFHLDTRGGVRVLLDDVGVANGIGFSPDRRRLYHADSQHGIRVFELDGGREGPPRWFAKQPGVDGLAVDAEGGVWTACYTSAELIRFHANGDIDRRIGFDAKEVLSVVFGGADLRDIYVVTGDFQNPESRTGAVYHARCDVAGQALPKTRF